MADAEVVLKPQSWNKFMFKVRAFFKTSYPKLFAAVAVHGFRDVMSHFKEEQGPTGPWQLRLSRTNRRYEQIRKGESNIPHKSKYRASNRLLQLSGDLRKSFLPSRGKVQQRKVTNFATMMFTPVPYAATHNFGDPGRNIPKREFMWLSPQAQLNILNTVMNDLGKAIR